MYEIEYETEDTDGSLLAKNLCAILEKLINKSSNTKEFNDNHRELSHKISETVEYIDSDNIFLDIEELETLHYSFSLINGFRETPTHQYGVSQYLSDISCEIYRTLMLLIDLRGEINLELEDLIANSEEFKNKIKLKNKLDKELHTLKRLKISYENDLTSKFSLIYKLSLGTICTKSDLTAIKTENHILKTQRNIEHLEISLKASEETWQEFIDNNIPSVESYYINNPKFCKTLADIERQFQKNIEELNRCHSVNLIIKEQVNDNYRFI